MNEQETIRFILENSSEPVIKNPVMRAALQEPRTMAQEPRNMYAGGQLVQNTADGSRPGYAVKKGSRPTTEPGGWKSRYKIKAFDEVADLFLNTYAKDDIDIIYKVGRETGNKISLIAKEPELLKHVSKQSGLTEKDIWDIIDDRKAHSELMHEYKTQQGRAKFDQPVKDLDNRMKNWLMKNSEKYADPEKFKKSFNRVFGKNNYIAKGIRKNKHIASMVGFVDEEFVKTYISDKIKNPKDFSFSSRQLDDMFKTLIYNNNENVRNKVVKTFTDILPKEKIKKAEVLDVHNAIKNNKFLQKFNLEKGINGPVARLIAKQLDADLVGQIDNFRKPFMGTRELINYLGDHVNPKYKSMFKEAEQAVLAMQSDKWSVARKNLDTGREIMFDHKIPSSLIEAGYADEIEYIKMNPTSQEFNVNIKAKKFDRPMNTLARKFEKAKTLDAKTKIYEEMVAKKDAFSKKYGNYLDEVKITMDEKGKLKFTSGASVVTKKTDLTKMLEKSLQQEKFPTMNKTQQHKFLKQAGFNIDKCLSSGGRVKLQGGKGVNTCITGVIEAEQKKALKTKNFGKFTKFGKFARTAGWFLGPLDIPVELAFALPHMLQGDKEAAKRATTLGLFGWGKDKREEVKESSPEAYKYIKHVEDTEQYVDSWFKNQDLNEEKKLLLEEQANVPEDRKELFSGVLEKQRQDLESQIMDTEETMNQIHAGYEGYDSIYEAAKGKNVLKDYLIQDIKEKTDKGLEMKDYGGTGMNIALGLPWDFGMKEGIPSKVKGGKPITNLKQWIEQKGQPYYKQLEHASYELGKAGEGLFDQYFTTADVKDPRDAYTELPTKYASGLGNLEKQEMLKGLKRKGKFMTRDFKDMLEAQGIDWEEAYDTGRAEGGIMNLKKKW